MLLRVGQRYRVTGTPNNNDTHICYGIKINDEYPGYPGGNPDNTSWNKMTGQCFYEFTMTNDIHSIEAEFVKRYTREPIYIIVHSQVHIRGNEVTLMSTDRQTWNHVYNDQVLPAGKYYFKCGLPVINVEGETFDIGGNAIALWWENFEPWTSLPNNGGYRTFHDNAFNIVDASKLVMMPPEDTNGDLCDYWETFAGCTLLEHGPILVDGITRWEARQGMCGYRPTYTTNGLYYCMFDGCTNLQSITCLLEPDLNDPAINDKNPWGLVGSSGIFYKKPGVTWPTELIPNGWTVQDFDMSQL